MTQTPEHMQTRTPPSQEDTKTVRDLDPNVRQRQSSDPMASVWVGASAGTGKTKVLVDRLLRLFLPRENGQPGTPPHRILCLTFTKAGANEMALRINKTLSKWAIMPEEDLLANLRALTGYEPRPEDIQSARRLFATVIDTPGGLKIMTIHSFCQSVLGRFPLEAGLPPHFTIIDETTAHELLVQARDKTLRTTPHKEALSRLAAAVNEADFMKLLHAINNEQTQLSSADVVFETLDVTPQDNVQTLMESLCQDNIFDKEGLFRACRALSYGGKKDQARGPQIQSWLEADPGVRVQMLDTYRHQFMTKKNTLLKSMASKNVLKADPDCADILNKEALRLMEMDEKIRAIKTAHYTHNLLTLGQEIIEEYQSLKEARAALDYNDLILKTLALLQQKDSTPWILFKLDGGLDHMLIDEAQDTNPEQWKIIAALCEDFFSGQNAHEDVMRTLFTVGDEKQSIYSFQRAAPQEFEKMKQHFAVRAHAAQQRWKDETLNISFRTTASILRFVDKVFAPDMPANAGLGHEIPEHHSYRTGQAGLVELWPLFKPEKDKEEFAPWPLPTSIIDSRSPQAQLADHIGDTIKNWLENGEELESQGRPIHAGDIMILVRSRSAFVGQVVRALKTRNIPVSGVDRMVLGQQIAVMDLLALAQFALLPTDDLTLACILKSPLIGWSEEQLYKAAIDRGTTSLWSQIKQSAEPEIINWLKDLIRTSRDVHPYEFFARILQRPCPTDHISGLHAIAGRLGEDALDPLDEFLNVTLAFEKDHIPALQNFLIWQQKEDITIKREMEEAGQTVRIMTVHGAKGLQAPIVILPDTTRSAGAKKTPRLLWPDKSGLDVPLWCPHADGEPALYKDARRQVETKLDEEYRRLLYVAMTRAEDRLYVGGHKTSKPVIEDSWYNYISAAFSQIEDKEERPFGPPKEEQTSWRISNPQTRQPDKPAKEQKQHPIKALSDISWLRTPAKAEPHPPRPLTPSRPSQAEPAAHSPFTSEDQYRFRRGNITHKLLQILPDLPPETWRNAAHKFVAQPGHDFPKAVQDNIISETLSILENPQFSALFGPGSQAEIPVTGFVNGQLISAQIDRLLVTDETVWIVDYKTNRPPPHKELDIPAVYRTQMRAYRDIVAAIYPARPIRSFLLWTDGPHLMELKNL